jgi:hypothetical protein
VALISQLENVLGPVWVWLAGIEHPAVLTIVGGIVVIGAVAFQITQGGGSPGRFHRPPDDLLGDLAGSVADPVLAEDLRSRVKPRSAPAIAEGHSPGSPAQAPDFTLRPIIVPLVSGVLASRPPPATPAMSS